MSWYEPRDLRGRYPDHRHFSRTPFWVSLVAWIFLPGIFLLWGLFTHVFMPGFGGLHSEWYQFAQQNVWAADGGFIGLSGTVWFWVVILSIITILAIVFLDDDETSHLEMGTAVLNVVLLIVGAIGFGYTSIYGDRDVAVFYNSATTIRVADVDNPPSSLSLLYNQRLTPRETIAEGESYRFGSLALVSEGTIPEDVWQWEPRTSSLSGASKWLRDKTPTRQGVDTWDATLTYVYGSDPSVDRDTTPWAESDAGESRWSVVVDGSGRTQSAQGVAEWRGGQTNVHVCAFDSPNSDGDYKFTRAFHGTNKNNLRNIIGDAYPSLFFNDQDVSGYCDENNRPVYVISMLQNVGAGVVTAPAPAGVLVLKGSRSGSPDVQHFENVAPGQFPVPVYPLSIVEAQRDAIDWAAGRGNKNGAKFGYEPSSYASQASNTSDYVLRSTTNGGIYAITPSKFRKTESQSYVLYQEIRVDSVTSGELNPMNAYVQEDNAAAVNPSLLDTNARIFMGWVLKQENLVEHIPVTFFSDGGSVQEFVPITTDVLRGYGVDPTGATRFYIDISASGTTNPLVTVLNITAGATVDRIELPSEVQSIGDGETLQPSVTLVCDGVDVASVPPNEVAACAQAYTDELVRRANE